MTANHIVAISETAGFFSTLKKLEKVLTLLRLEMTEVLNLECCLSPSLSAADRIIN